jgi:hypothetical protein
LHHLEADQLETTLLEPAHDLADKPTLDPVRLDQDQRALRCHGY